MTISVSCEAASSAANLGALSLTARTCYVREYAVSYDYFSVV